MSDQTDEKFATMSGTPSAQSGVDAFGASVPELVEPAVLGAHGLAVERHEEFVHRAHHVRMRVERAACEAHIGGPVFAKTFHELTAAAEHADRKSAAQRLAIGDQVGAYAEIFLGAAQGQAKAHEHFVEDEHDAALAAD